MIGHGPAIQQIADTIKDHHSNFSNPQLQQISHNLRKKVLNDDLIVTKADKGNSIVILDRSEYNSKVNDFLTSSNAVVYQDFDFDKFCENVRKTVNKCEYVIREPHTKRSILISNPRIQLLHGLPKVHKPGIPIRPVVSFVHSPTYRLAKFLDTWFRHVSEINSFFAIRNSKDLVGKLLEAEPLPSNSTLVSFDVVGLYPNVPILPIILEFVNILEEKGVPPPTISEFITLLKLCLQPNFCEFNNNTYRLPDFVGVPTGSPIAPLVAEVFMSSFESLIFSNTSDHTPFIHY